MTQLITEAIRIANILSEEDQNAIAITLFRENKSLTKLWQKIYSINL